MNETYEEYMNRKLLESVQYKPKEEPTTITLYADDKPYQVIDLKDIDDMSEEEYNDKLKDAWFKKTHYETVEELTMSKYYNYEVDEEEEEKEKDFPNEPTDWSDVVSGIIYYGAIVGLLICAIIGLYFGG